MAPTPRPPVIVIDTQRIIDWASFHSVFAEAFGFPAFYGNNMDAWIDCMSYLDDVDAGMTNVHCPSGTVVTIQLTDPAGLAARCPELFNAFIECAAFVNWRRLEQGEPSVLAVAFYKT